MSNASIPADPSPADDLGRFGPAPRRATRQVAIGGVMVGGAAPVVVQSMTNTDTADIAASVKQVAELWRAGSELVRLTVNNPESAAAIPRIRDKLAMMGVSVPLIGDFHYNGHQLLAAEPACAEALAKYRINPGNVGFGKKRDTQFAQLIELAIRYGKPVRIGANWGSLDQSLAATLMDENAQRDEPWDAGRVLREALIRSALDSAHRAVELGLPAERIRWLPSTCTAVTTSPRGAAGAAAGRAAPAPRGGFALAEEEGCPLGPLQPEMHPGPSRFAHDRFRLPPPQGSRGEGSLPPGAGSGRGCASSPPACG